MPELIRFDSNRTDEDAMKIALARFKDSQNIFNKHKKRFKQRNCPCCGHEKHRAFDRFHNMYQIVKCIRCSSRFVNPCPDQEALDDYYSNGTSIEIGRQILEKRKDRKENSYIFDDRIKAISNVVKKNNLKKAKILEIGCGTGLFLERLRTQFINLEMEFLGIEIDPNSATIAKQRGFSIINENAENLLQNQNQQFDIIIHFELIEHLIDPRMFIMNCRNLLEPDGYMILTTCNEDGLDNQSIGYNWPNRMMAHALFPPMHLNAYNTRNIYFTLLDLGLQNINIMTPGKLDIDIIRKHKDYGELKTDFQFLMDLPEEVLGQIQNLISLLNSSGHMLVSSQKS